MKFEAQTAFEVTIVFDPETVYLVRWVATGSLVYSGVVVEDALVVSYLMRGEDDFIPPAYFCYHKLGLVRSMSVKHINIITASGLQARWKFAWEDAEIPLMGEVEKRVTWTQQ